MVFWICVYSENEMFSSGATTIIHSVLVDKE